MSFPFSPNKSKKTSVRTDRLLDRTDKNNQDNVERTAKFFTPTETLLNELQSVYSYFNQCLFDGQLPECMLTIDQSGKCTLGYFSPYNFVSKQGDVIHQISLNPEHLLTRPLRDVLSTLTHEQCHLWEYALGGRKKPSSYHGKPWARQMETIGLIPSDTGLPGGKKTGYRMSHYIVENGPFDRACNTLANGQFALSWGLATDEMRYAAVFGDESLKPESGRSEIVKKKERSKGKVKFVCPTCNKPCWAAPSRKLVCGDDGTRLEQA